ncbi:MAG TPA: MFS transporter [Elusimicrobia bacterium]|nr:MAG: MFS transporter [Elusimicrobia bacterium GWF2_62_30]HBA59960.1 MFS transporter [Elusimicrobiota bacterium]
MIAKAENRSPWAYVPTTYFAEGLPYMIVNALAVIVYKKMGVSNTLIAFWTSWLYLPWVIKMLWGPLIDMYATKRSWIIATQALMTAAIAFAALSLKTPHFLYVSMICFMGVAFLSATHDIAVDGFYMLSMDDKKQAFFVGIRAFCYRLAMLFSSGVLVMLAGRIESATGNIQNSWTVVLLLAAAVMGLLAVYHKVFLPYPAVDRPDEAKAGQLSEFGQIFAAYFKMEGVGLGVAFILLYRFGEAMLLKLAAPFLLDKAEAGGMAFTTTQVGVAYGTIGLICLIIGGLLGGWLISKFGLRRCIWPLALALNAPDLVYVYMSFHTDLPPTFVYGLVAVEQFGYGLGTTAFMFYMMQLTGERYKTAHFAISTGIMALGMMLPGFISGKLQAVAGYPKFFIIVCLATLPGMLLIPLLKYKEELKRA